MLQFGRFCLSFSQIQTGKTLVLPGHRRSHGVLSWSYSERTWVPLWVRDSCKVIPVSRLVLAVLLLSWVLCRVLTRNQIKLWWLLVINQRRAWSSDSSGVSPPLSAPLVFVSALRFVLSFSFHISSCLSCPIKPSFASFHTLYLLIHTINPASPKFQLNYHLIPH